ncbi:transposase [Arsenophonus sp. ENCA]|uniref:transposase n=1 Tax=Arsenophonus sp. ENCA TaxID=1987579 RepID=UPI0025BDDDD5|nr:transposase [Arsenophonus sp. ENCA]
MVEPVFSALRGIQGLERFRRKGLLAVKLEFTLHAMAYNLSRAVALILWMIFSLLFVQTKIRKRENLHGGILLKKNSTPFATASDSAGPGRLKYLVGSGGSRARRPDLARH